MSRDDGDLTRDQEHALKLVRALESLAEGQALVETRVNELVTALKPPAVLYSGSLLIPSTGIKHFRFEKAIARSVSVVAGASSVVIQGGPDEGSAPSAGVGVFLIRPGASRTVAIASADVTIYGTAGDVVSLEIRSELASPAAAADAIRGGQGHKSEPVAVAVAGAAVQLLAANPNRKSALIANNGPGTLYVGVDNTVTAANGIPIASGAVLTDDTSVDAWFGIAAAAPSNADARVLEVA